MKYLTSVGTHPILNNSVLLIARVVIGFAMLAHGYPKLQMLLSGEEIKFFNFLGLGEQFSLTLAVFAEFVCSIFLILGLFTRWSAFFLLFTMIIAFFVIHGADPFELREKSLLYLIIYLSLLVCGPGKYSVDGMISSKSRRSQW